MVDTNIVFSAILNTDSNIVYLLLNSSNVFIFYSAKYLQYEIENHKNKLIEISHLKQKEIEEVKNLIYGNIKFLSEEQIPSEVWKRSVAFVGDVDMDDIAFVAMSEYLNTDLWTGDKKLTKGLQAKGFERCVRTQDLLAMRTALQRN